MDQLYEYMQRVLNATTSTFLRYAYAGIDWSNRLLGLVGPPGVGKTTLFLQHIKLAHSQDDALYVSADHMYFAGHTLYDTAGALYKSGGHYFYIDEVHKYPTWSRELKAMHDAFPDLHVYFTGSSILDIESGAADLSRRAPQYTMQGLSFREYLNIWHGVDLQPTTLQAILAHEYAIPGIDHPLPLFKAYLRNGYYPFSSEPDFSMRLGQVIERTLGVDIPQFANMNASTGFKLKQLMMAVSELVPFKPNLSKLASQIRASRNNIEDYLVCMEKAGMVALLRNEADKLSSLAKPEKVYLDNTNILYNLAQSEPDIGTVRETFFLNQMRVGHAVTASRCSDFEVDGITFEIGGKSKTQSQIKGIEQGYVAEDDIEYGNRNVIPLWAFGLIY